MNTNTIDVGQGKTVNIIPPGLPTSNPTCEQCGLYKQCTTPMIRHRGNVINPKIVLIGEAPGWNEDRQGAPFVGKSGLLLKRILGEKFGAAYLTNAVKCAPYEPGTQQKKVRKPKREEIKHCRTYLIQELERLNPAEVVLMPLGGTALTSLQDGKEAKITKEAGMWRTMELAGKQWQVLPNYHPAYILRNENMEGQFQSIFTKAFKGRS